MHERITSIENLIARDPGGRNVFGLVVADQLRLAAQSLRLAKRVGIVSGFFVPSANAGETDGPPGAKVLGSVLQQLGVEVDYITDRWNAPLFEALGVQPIVDVDDYLAQARPTHLLSIERVGRGPDGRYRNMKGFDITATTAPLDELFIKATRVGLTTIGIGDGGNEIGMGKVFVDILDTADSTMTIDNGATIATTVRTDFCIVAGVSNWGGYGLAGALSILEGRDLMPSADALAHDIEQIVRNAGAVDGVTYKNEPTVDGLDLTHSIRMLENIRRQIAPSPFERGVPLTVGILGYGEAGRAAAALLAHKGHRVCISDRQSVTLDRGTVVAGVETGGHTVEFLGQCDLVVASPGVRPDAPIRNALHRRGIPVMSEMEMAYQLCTRPLIGVTGTVGKRTTVELVQQLFELTGRALTIGGNKGRPLSELLFDANAASSPDASGEPIALAVSSFQLETVVHFRPHVSVFLNIDEAHLDRHQSVAEYVRIKSRIFMNHRPDDVLILSFDDDHVRPLARKHRGRTFYVSRRQAVDRGAWLADGVLYVNVDGKTAQIAPADPRFAENFLSAVVSARLSGISSEELAQAIPKLPGTGVIA